MHRTIASVITLAFACCAAPLAAAQLGVGGTGGGTGGGSGAGGGVAAARAPVAATAGPKRSFRQYPPVSWNQQDPADSLYSAGRRALNDGEYARAAELFNRIVERYPRSTYAPDALYWKAFALYRRGGQSELRAALTALKLQAKRYPKAGTRKDGEQLEVRIQGALAQGGDAASAERLMDRANDAARPSAGARGQGGGSADRAPRARSSTASDCPRTDDDDLKVAALNGLLQMDADRAVPILKQVLDKRDACSAPLRRKAVFLLSQKRTTETEDILLNSARTDPDKDVREQAVFWLSQVGTEKSLRALEDILRTSKDAAIQDKALFALSQHRAPRAAAALRDFAERSDVSASLRERAIFWLGQSRSEENAAYLRGLYPRIADARLREKLIFSISQMPSEQNQDFIMRVALDTRESMQVRKQALFWAGQMKSVPIGSLTQLYARMPDRAMKEQLVFVYSQRKEKEAVDKLIEIARSDSDRELRKKALFWLSQSKDPRVADLLMEIVNQ